MEVTSLSPETKYVDTDEHFNSDLPQVPQAPTSKSSDGPFLTPETQNRNLLYEDDTGRLFGVLDTDGRFYIHTELYQPGTPSVLKHYMGIMGLLENNLRERGVQQYYTMADSVSGFKFNEFMGFRTIYEVWNGVYEIMVKDI